MKLRFMSVCVWACVCASVCTRTGGQVLQHGLGKALGPEELLVYNHSSVLPAGEPGREVTPWQAPAAPDSWQLRFPDGLRQLLQGRAPCSRRHPWGAASPAAAREHLAAPQGPAPPEAAAVRFPAGRSAGGSRGPLSSRGRLVPSESVGGCVVIGGLPVLMKVS